MRDFRDAKAMAQTLRDALKAKSISVSHSESLELVAKTLGFHDWNVLSAAIQSSQPAAAKSPPALSFNGGTVIPVAPMRDIVFFPQLISPMFVGREKTRRAVESAAANDGRIVVITQRRAEDDDPDFDALYSVGVVADIMNRVELPNGNQKVRVSCGKRVAVVRPAEADFLAAEVVPLEEVRALDTQAFALTSEIFEAYRSSTNTVPPQSLYRYAGEPGVLADVVVQLLEIGVEKMQQALEIRDVVARLETILGWMRAGAPAKAS
ncbi:LON peptidase substrate-binding domain-containing protein [Bradyrhizobium neotropicale]|uniref:LON peptidase substrate-binding domain-containing protein n=1 Tax=Bradyrhizobium neotropicale TaxID=1497615 RepID=UPI001AD71679|nr:LON peptidase substrate-binding domain-containing protein [Bradyrhizobium neotropicale]MBO4228292.1 endopeptidase La [Bradyrhizobium neotropicale]